MFRFILHCIMRFCSIHHLTTYTSHRIINYVSNVHVLNGIQYGSDNNNDVHNLLNRKSVNQSKVS